MTCDYYFVVIFNDILAKTHEEMTLTFILLPSWRYCAIDLAMVSKKNQEYCDRKQKEKA